MLSWAGARCGLFAFPKDTPPTDIIIICFGVVLGIPGVVRGIVPNSPCTPLKNDDSFTLQLVRGCTGGCTGSIGPGLYGRMFQTFACTEVVQGLFMIVFP